MLSAHNAAALSTMPVHSREHPARSGGPRCGSHGWPDSSTKRTRLPPSKQDLLFHHEDVTLLQTEACAAHAASSVSLERHAPARFRRPPQSAEKMRTSALRFADRAPTQSTTCIRAARFQPRKSLCEFLSPGRGDSQKILGPVDVAREIQPGSSITTQAKPVALAEAR